MNSVLKATRSVLYPFLLYKCNDFKFVAVQLINVEVIQDCVWYMMKKNNEATPSFWKFPLKRFPSLLG